jgi:hypothetical protein
LCLFSGILIPDKIKYIILQGYGQGMTEPAFPLMIREVGIKVKEKKGLAK